MGKRGPQPARRISLQLSGEFREIVRVALSSADLSQSALSVEMGKTKSWVAKVMTRRREILFEDAVEILLFISRDTKDIFPSSVSRSASQIYGPISFRKMSSHEELIPFDIPIEFETQFVRNLRDFLREASPGCIPPENILRRFLDRQQEVLSRSRIKGPVMSADTYIEACRNYYERYRKKNTRTNRVAKK